MIYKDSSVNQMLQLIAASVGARGSTEFRRKGESEMLVAHSNRHRTELVLKRGSGETLKSLRKYKNKLNILSLERPERQKF